MEGLDGLEQFVIELQMMVDCDRFLAWGVSSVHEFVKEGTKQLNDNRNKKFFKKV